MFGHLQQLLLLFGLGLVEFIALFSLNLGGQLLNLFLLKVL